VRIHYTRQACRTFLVPDLKPRDAEEPPRSHPLLGVSDWQVGSRLVTLKLGFRRLSDHLRHCGQLEFENLRPRQLMTSLARPPDEFANFITHGLGFLLSLAAVGYLIAQIAGQPADLLAACSLYSMTLLLVYGSSTLSHLFYDSTWRQRFRTWDQASIFLLIAGTYTPFAVMYLDHGAWQWLLVCIGACPPLVSGGLCRFEICRVATSCHTASWDFCPWSR